MRRAILIIIMIVPGCFNLQFEMLRLPITCVRGKWIFFKSDYSSSSEVTVSTQSVYTETTGKIIFIVFFFIEILGDSKWLWVSMATMYENVCGNCVGGV
jgi:hypothetical protein